jgi:ABC-type glycerol-3-phosphate transport system substrate-binding protein
MRRTAGAALAACLTLAACGPGNAGAEPAATVDSATRDADLRAETAAAKARAEELQRQTDEVTAAARERDQAARAEAAADERAPAIRAAEEREIERARKEAEVRH